MVRAESRNIRTAGIDTNHPTMFTLLLELNVICDQRWIQFELQNSSRRVFAFDGKIYTTIYWFSKPVKSDHNYYFWYFQNNHIKTTKFAQSNPVLIRQFWKKLQSDPVLIRPKLASVLIQSDPVLIRAHLCHPGSLPLFNSLNISHSIAYL